MLRWSKNPSTGLRKSWWSGLHLRCGLTGLLLFGLHLILFLLSPRFTYGSDWFARPILLLVGIEVAAGSLYLVAVWGGKKTDTGKNTLAWMVAVGVLLRGCFLTSAPMLEDDYYRYLWDGAVVVAGENPYAYAPRQIVDENTTGVPSALRELARDSGQVILRVNNPDLRSIYPPVAQAAFALAHVLRPWSLIAWRLVLFLFDVAALAILLALFRTLRLSLSWLAVYWWNPVLIKETYNSGHMDVVVVPFVLGALLLAVHGKYVWAAGMLALATGAKLWPVALFPLLMRPVFGAPRRVIPASSLFALLCCVLFLPVRAAALDSASGFVEYARRWEMNDALFMGIKWLARGLLQLFGLDTAVARSVARVVVLVTLTAWIGWLVRRNVTGPDDLCERCLLAVAAMFLLSPTQYPWYYVWIVPFLAIRPEIRYPDRQIVLPGPHRVRDIHPVRRLP